jgi:hypothetical protein
MKALYVVLVALICGTYLFAKMPSKPQMPAETEQAQQQGQKQMHAEICTHLSEAKKDVDMALKAQTSNDSTQSLHYIKEAQIALQHARSCIEKIAAQ